MRIALIACASAALTACATPTVFAPAGSSAYASGFNDSRIEANRYRVTYRGGSGAPPALVRDFALLRAADLTREAGYEWFRVVDRFGEASAPRSSSSVSIGGGSASYERRSATGVGVGLSFPLGGSGPQLSETLEIVLGRGARPPGADVYDAADVQRSVRARSPLPPPA